MNPLKNEQNRSEKRRRPTVFFDETGNVVGHNKTGILESRLIR